jgi:hypothetical protein
VAYWNRSVKRRLFALIGLGCIIVAIYWFSIMRLSSNERNTADRKESDGRNAVVTATANLDAAEATRPPSDRADPVKMFEAVEATNVAISLWGKVIDQDARSLSGVKIKYDYTIEHGNLSGIAWSDQELRTGEIVSDEDGLFSIRGLRGHNLTILNFEKAGYQFRSKGDMTFDFFGSTASGKFVPEQHRPIVFTMVQREQMEPLIHVKGSLRVRGEEVPERWNLWEGEPDPNGELAVTLRREPAVLERPGQAATWSADLEIIGGGIVEAFWDEDVRRAPEAGYLPTIAYPQADQKRGVPYRSFYVKTADGRFGRIQIKLDAYSQGATVRCSITGDMNPRRGSRNLEPSDEE